MKESDKAPTKGDSKSTLEDTAKIHIVLLQLNGILPFSRDIKYQLIQLFNAIFAHFCYAFTFSIYTWGFIKPLYEGNINLTILPQSIGAIGTQARFILLYVRRAKIFALFEFSKELWMNLNDSEIIIARKSINKSVKLCYWYLTVCAMLVFSFVMTFTLLNQNSHSQSNETRRRYLMCPFYTDVQLSPWYEVVIALQLITRVAFDVYIAGVDTAATFFIMIACGYLRTLNDRIDSLSKINDLSQQRNIEKKIIDCIIFHQKIIEYADQIREIMSLFFFIQLTTTTYNISLDILAIVKEGIKQLKYIPVFTIQLTQLFLCQWAPDKLLYESISLSESAYFVPFSGYSNKKLSRIILLLMLRAQRPISFSAGGLLTLSMESFKKLLTSAWSFFTLLYSV